MTQWWVCMTKKTWQLELRISECAFKNDSAGVGLVWILWGHQLCLHLHLSPLRYPQEGHQPSQSRSLATFPVLVLAFPESNSALLRHSQPSFNTQCFGGSWLYPKPASTLSTPSRLWVFSGWSMWRMTSGSFLEEHSGQKWTSHPCLQNTDRPFRTQAAVLNSFVPSPFMVLHSTWDVRIPSNISRWKETRVGNITHASTAVGAVLDTEELFLSWNRQWSFCRGFKSCWKEFPDGFISHCVRLLEISTS